jgi:hypothetical protein
MLPSKRRGQTRSLQLGMLGNNLPVTCRIMLPGQAGLCVLSDSRLISSADLGKMRRFDFSFRPEPVFVFEVLSRWQKALMDANLVRHPVCREDDVSRLGEEMLLRLTQEEVAAGHGAAVETEHMSFLLVENIEGFLGHDHVQHQLVAQDLASLANYIRVCCILDDGQNFCTSSFPHGLDCRCCHNRPPCSI